jgi:hypothetical protein
MDQGPAQTQAPSNGSTHLDSEEVVLAAVQTALRDIEFGSVLIKIHQGEVVGIETSTKVRLKGGRGPL